MKDMHDPSDMTATELDPTEDEMALGIVAVRVVEWGVSAVALGDNAAVSMRLVQACHWGNP